MISTQEMLIRLGVATLLGGLIGLERERVESAAGLRTHAVVALGAALFMIVSMFGFTNAIRPPGVVLDPSRVAAQIVTGIGFIGAGVIIFRREIIRGLTTAASVWLVAALGMAVGGGLYSPAVGATAIGLAVLAVMKPIERRLIDSRRPQWLRIVMDRRQMSLGELREALTASGAVVDQIDARYSEDPTKSRVDVLLRRATSERIAHLLENLPERTGVREVRSTLDLGGSAAREARDSLLFVRDDGEEAAAGPDRNEESPRERGSD